MKVRFEIRRSTHWHGLGGALHFAVPHVAEYPAEEGDHVGDLLAEVMDAAIPRDFEFIGMTPDRQHFGGQHGVEGIEFVEHQEPPSLCVGDVIDVEITVVRRA